MAVRVLALVISCRVSSMPCSVAPGAAGLVLADCQRSVRITDTPMSDVNAIASRRRAFLSAEWRYLIMLNFEVDAAILRPLVPEGTTIDLWRGRALVSVVGFRFLHTRMFGVPVPFHGSFDEVNVRFYVRHTTPNGEKRRGVVFVRELVPRKAIAIVARLVYNEPYATVPMRSTAPAGELNSIGRVSYEWYMAGQWERMAVTAVGLPNLPLAESEAEFVTDHYWGYTRQRDGATVEYEVAHPPWRVWSASAPELGMLGNCGKEFEDAFAEPPSSVLLAEGSPVVVFSPCRIILPSLARE